MPLRRATGESGPERYWLDNDSAVKEAGPVEGPLAAQLRDSSLLPELAAHGPEHVALTR